MDIVMEYEVSKSTQQQYGRKKKRKQQEVHEQQPVAIEVVYPDDPNVQKKAKTIENENVRIVDPKILIEINKLHEEPQVQPVSDPTEAESSTDDLHSARNETLTLTQTTEPITQTTEPISQQTQPITQQTQPISQQTQPITQMVSPTTQTTQVLSQSQNLTQTTQIIATQQTEQPQSTARETRSKKSAGEKNSQATSVKEPRPRPKKPRIQEKTSKKKTEKQSLKKGHVGSSSTAPQESLCVAAPHQPVRAETKKPSPYNVKHTATKFMEVVKRLTPEQKKEVEQIGFGPLLSIDFPQYESSLTEKLVESFIINRCSFRLEKQGEELQINEEDAHCVYGLPLGRQPMKESTSRKVLQHREFMQEWREHLGIKDKKAPTVQQLREKLITPPQEVTKHFITDFVVFAVNCLIKSTTNKSCNIKFLKFVSSVDNIKQLNWSRFVVDSLIASVSEFRGGEKTYFTGPVPFMMIVYFDRVRVQYIVEPRTFPLIACWQREGIRKRLKFEREQGFGEGIILPRIDYAAQRFEAPEPQQQQPTIHAIEGQPILQPPQQEQDPHTSGEEFQAPTTLKEFILEFTKLLNDMGSNFIKFGTLLQTAQQIFPSNQINLLMGNAMSELLNKWANKVKLSQETQNEEVPVFLSQDDSFFGSDAVNEMMKKFEKDATDTFRGKKVVGADIEPPSFSLGLGSSQPSQRSPSVTYNDFVHLRPGRESCEGLEHIMSTPRQPTIQDLFEDDIQAQSEIMNKAQHNKGVALEEHKREKRIVQDLPSIFRSPYLSKNQNLFKNMKKLHTTISDYAFEEEDVDLQEVLYNDGFTTINRTNMLTLSMDNHVMNNIIDAYVSLLNQRNKERAREATNRMFFKTTAFVLLCTNDVNNEKVVQSERIEQFIETLNNEMVENSIREIDEFELVFFPILAHDHYYVFCFNMIEHDWKIEVLDNRLLEDVSFKSKYKDYPKKMRNAFIMFRSRRGLPNVEALDKMSSTVKKMPWRDNKNHNDCGIFVMRHMETYMGQHVQDWDSGLQKDDEKIVKKLRVQYCAEIILSNRNKNQQEVQKKAKAKEKTKGKEKLKDV